MIRPNPKFLKNIPANIRAKWAKALITTKARQLRGRMFNTRNGQTYMCCLMVGHVAFGGTDEQRDGETPEISSPFSAAMGDRNPDIGINEYGLTESAAECNDEQNFSFREIAALVYPQLWRLEKRKQK